MNNTHYPTVSIVILSYNSAKLGQVFIDCIESVLDTDYPTFEVILVDNCSSDTSAEDIATKFGKIRLLRLPKNLGYSGGNNEGAKVVSCDSQFIVFLNSDVLLAKDWLKLLVDIIAKNNEIGVVGVEGVAKSVGGKTFYLPRLKNPFYAQVAQGYCLLVQRQLFELVGGFNDKLFMYEDEVDFCNQIHSVGYKVAIITTDSVKHLGAQSIRANQLSVFQTYQIARNTFYTLYESVDTRRLPLAIVFQLLYGAKRSLFFRDWFRMKATIEGMVDGFFGMKDGIHSKTGRHPVRNNLPPMSLDIVSLFMLMRTKAHTIEQKLLLDRIKYVR